MKKTTWIIEMIFAIVLIIASCTRNNINPTQLSPNLPNTPYDYLNISIEGRNENLSNIIMDDSKNSINNASVTLGRVLFYDKVLSINNTVSCGTCHQQQFAFSDQMKLSTGFGNKKTLRNSMSIQNVVLNNNMFWDSREQSALDMSLKPVFNHLEMGIENDEMLVKKIKSTSYYNELFKNAFGNSEITKEKISLAITHFLHATFSQNSKFDKQSATGFSGFTEMEKLGKDLFFSERLKCSECHAGSNFSAPDNIFGTYGTPEIAGTANIGLDRVSNDPGKNGGNFKIPSLRNIELTGPYMHDGRFATLEEVLNHYSDNIKDNSNLDIKFKDKNGRVKKLAMTQIEKDAIIAFLKTLTDQSLISDKKFSDPFAK